MEIDQPPDRRSVSGAALQHLLEGDLRAIEVRLAVRVELAEPHVDGRLLLGLFQQPGELHPRLLGRFPVARVGAEVGVGLERAHVIG